MTKQKTHPNRHPIRAPESGPPCVRAAPGGDLACGNFYAAHFDKIRMTIKSIQTNAKTPSDTVVAQLRQEKKVCNHKNQRNEGPTGGRTAAVDQSSEVRTLAFWEPFDLPVIIRFGNRVILKFPLACAHDNRKTIPRDLNKMIWWYQWYFVY